VKYSESQISIYPNPIQDYINISNKAAPSLVKVYAADGRIVYSGTRSKINTVNWANGVYELIIVGTSEVEVERFRLVK